MDTVQFGQRLKNLRLERGLSKAELSKRIGQGPHYIYDIEMGRTYPSLASFFQLCHFLQITPADFFDLDLINPPIYHFIFEEAQKMDAEHLDILLDYLRHVQAQ